MRRLLAGLVRQKVKKARVGQLAPDGRFKRTDVFPLGTISKCRARRQCSLVLDLFAELVTLRVISIALLGG